MSSDTITLTVEGVPDEAVQIWYRGDRDSDAEDPAPIVFTGHLDSSGALTIQVPKAYLVLGRPVRKGGVPMSLQNETGEAFTIRMPKA